MIKFQDITKIYPSSSSSPTVALENVSFEIKPNEFVSIAGRSGAGKTTLLRLLLAEEKPTRGRIFFDDKDLSKIKSSQLPQIRRKIGAVFQDYKLLPSKTVYENVTYVMEVIGASDEEIKRDAPQVLEIVGLEERVQNFPAELSAGERQRVAIARALVHRPEVILADEPTGNLDPYNALDIIRLLLKIHTLGTTVILATHNKEIINSLGKRVITLEKGRVIRDEEKGRFIL
ncbi:MAG: cell division ATP-binding protein FtsE [Candidatus Nealsonbacteria bacterium CG_4_8_14_3_um_filter_37_36]|uniref:Cell division ATP-binding protein FtsE n=4 Tax=Candidatus Nealsoniibacteriota TaxID=1817911 RepID=A0A2M7EBG0_9BACT|nr:MAG: cell division ATP-binding protein FtsE [Candidatus Nealsonbacteria bacterium CG01_land_8_20_14_3_00_12]PIW35292.1 MAG: cell division ATP-binding protein FtsE [Candidatus Nealsonbacteria bacterium CG15_BIG_FIL_POST_REV_8_21_14_020_37_12]PIW91302.1 MAG: cell division ATP-binding protein FtsE [Candidatus Nealsonbacteria bacterium CG_4_8_14_3_um_filter_37_36]PJA82414.1 MAG: cell division ATP-binding protein FtsE [Candidatus Nealsonbacteria bacterium CG_4_9_14_3_um_filter_37_29]